LGREGRRTPPGGKGAAGGYQRRTSAGGIQYHLDLGERHFSDKVLETLDAIRTGKAEDKYGWNYIV